MNSLATIEKPDCLNNRQIIDAVHTEQWEYADADTQLLTHNIHRYSGKFIPQIAARAITLLTQPGELVLDPFCGSGTTLVEAVILNRRAMGIDLSPLAILIARTKVRPIPNDKLLKLRRYMSDCISRKESLTDSPLFESSRDTFECISEIQNDPRFSDDWYKKWFKTPILEDLLFLDQSISRIREDSCRDVARVAFSNILRKSSNAHQGYPNVMFHKSASERTRPFRPFLKALDTICSMIAQLERTNANWSDVTVKQGNASHLPLEDESIDAVISHPPYIGSIPYAEYGALSLKWLGADHKALDRELTGGRRQSPDVVDRFKSSYGDMIRESSRVLRHNRYMFLMVGNPVVKGEIIDLAKMTIELAEAANFTLSAKTIRAGVNRRANKMGDEHLLFFQKITPGAIRIPILNAVNGNGVKLKIRTRKKSVRK